MKTRKVYEVEMNEEVRCPECRFETSVLVVLANSRKEAEEKAPTEGVCPYCFTQEIEGWEVILPEGRPAVKVGEFRIAIEGSINEGWLDLIAYSPDCRSIHINNLNYIISEVIEPIIPDWEKREEIVEGTAIVGNREELWKVLDEVKKLEGDKELEKVLEEEFQK